MRNYYIIIPILFPIFLSLILVIKRFSEKNRNVFVGAGISLNFLLTLEIFLEHHGGELRVFRFSEFLDFYFKVDKLGMLFAILVSTLWIFTTIYAMEYMKHERKVNRFFIFFCFTYGITLGLAFSGNLITLYVFYELLTLSTYPLVIHNGSREALASGKKYLIYSFTGAAIVLMGIVLLHSVTHNLDFSSQGVLKLINSEELKVVVVSFFLMFVGFGVKAALVPFHSWLPEAMVAPTPVSALLHAVAVVKSGIFSLFRISYFIFGTKFLEQTNIKIPLSILIILTILLGSILAINQRNLKKRLAYSTVSQLGYILLGIIMVNENALLGGLFHLINHAVIKITLFFVIGTIIYTTGKTEIDEIAGIGKQMPITMGCFAVCSISLIGIPPTNGFVSKWFLALGGLSTGKIIFPVILLLSAILTALYLLPIVTEAFFKKPHNEVVTIKEAPVKMLVPIVCVTTIVVFLGLFPNQVLHFLHSIVNEIL